MPYKDPEKNRICKRNYERQNYQRIKEYRKQHPEIYGYLGRKEYFKKWAKNNLEKMKMYNERYKGRRKKYIRKNKEKMKEYQKIYRKINKEKLSKQQKNYSEIRSYIWSLAKSLNSNNFKKINEKLYTCPICGNKKAYSSKQCVKCYNKCTWNKGKHLSEEHKRNIREAELGKIISPETREKIRKIQTGRKLPEEQKIKIRERLLKNPPNLGKHLSEEQKLKISEKKKGIKLSEETKRKISIGNKGKIISIKQRQQISEKLKIRYKNDSEFLRKKYLGLNKKPNTKEKIIDNIIKMYNLSYEYVGNGKIWIEGRNPDFINVNGQKKVIELFGDYWHTRVSKETPEERINHFKKYGFDCLVIWEKELKHINDVIDKIVRFDKYGSTNNF